MRSRQDIIDRVNLQGVQAAQLEVLLDIRDLLLTAEQKAELEAQDAEDE